MEEIEITATTRSKGSILVRIFAWGASIAAAPITGGASLAVPILLEPAFRFGMDGQIQDEASKRVPYSDVKRELLSQVNDGYSEGSVNVNIDLGDVGYGKVKQEWKFKIR